MYDTVLFDFDGVLADTEPLHFQAWRDALATAGVSLDWDYYVTSCIGLADREMVEALGRRSDPPKVLDELWPLYPMKNKIFQSLAFSSDLISNSIIEAIKSLRNIKIGVVTSSSRAEIEYILINHKLLDLLDVCVYGDEVSRLKPDPEPYLTAVERLGSNRALVFEDSASGLASARAAGCDVVQVIHPAELPELIRRHLPDFR